MLNVEKEQDVQLMSGEWKEYLETQFAVEVIGFDIEDECLRVRYTGDVPESSMASAAVLLPKGDWQWERVVFERVSRLQGIGDQEPPIVSLERIRSPKVAPSNGHIWSRGTGALSMRVGGSMYQYKAHVLRVVDGDTVDMRVDVGFHHFFEGRFRLFGVDTPEQGQEGFYESKALVTNICLDKDVYIETYKSADKYGRYLANIWLTDGLGNKTVFVNEELLKRGLAEAY